jgi:hypothetical protein
MQTLVIIYKGEFVTPNPPIFKTRVPIFDSTLPTYVVWVSIQEGRVLLAELSRLQAPSTGKKKNEKTLQ